MGDKRPSHKITRSYNQNPNIKTEMEIKPIDSYNGSHVIFDDMLGARNGCQIVEFFTRRRQKALNACLISQRYFILPRQSIRNNSDRILLPKQTLGDVESLYKDTGCYDMK